MGELNNHLYDWKGKIAKEKVYPEQIQEKRKKNGNKPKSCDQIVRFFFSSKQKKDLKLKKSKYKLLLTLNQKRKMMQWAGEEQSWTVIDWIKVILWDNCQSGIGQSLNARNLVLWKSTETYKEHKTEKKSFHLSYLWYELEYWV